MTKNKEITIVTAFFDIGRSEAKDFKRDNQKYIDAFRFWARIKNNIVVYSDKETIKEVIKIRKEFGLLDKTKTIIIDDYLTIDSELYESINNSMNNKEYLKYHMQMNIPEATNSKYNYIMAIKAWCCSDAVNKGLTTDMVCWLDFGFNYNGKYYKNSEDFNFMWDWNFSDKIHLLQVNDFDDLPVFEIVRRNNAYIQGGEIVAPKELWSTFWNLIRNNMLALCKCGLPDDDQILYLMSYKENKELFELHKCEWLGLFKDFSDHKFEFEIPRNNKIKSFIHKIRHPNEIKFFRVLFYSIRTFFALIKTKQRG